MIAKGDLWSLILRCARSVWLDRLSWRVFLSTPVHLFLLRWPPVHRKSTKGPVEPGTFSAVEPYILKNCARCTNVFCMLHDTCPCKGQENTAHTSRVERYIRVQITKMWFVCDLYAVRIVRNGLIHGSPLGQIWILCWKLHGSRSYASWRFLRQL